MSDRTRLLAVLACTGSIALAGCNGDKTREAAMNMGPLNVLDESGISDIMLNFADPNQAVNYFRDSLQENPDRVDFKRGLASSLVRAGRTDEAIAAYDDLIETGEATSDDRLKYAEALIQGSDWEGAGRQLDTIPPTVETYDRYRLEAMMADYRKEWDKSDAFYETARGLTTRPATILNNWGISKMSRGDQKGAEEKFRQAITFDPKLFNAKNNMAIARARAGNYQLPVVPMSEVERAQLLHNMALQAIRNGDVDTGRGMLEEAVDVHPQHFAEAIDKLEALERKVTR